MIHFGNPKSFFYYTFWLVACYIQTQINTWKKEAAEKLQLIFGSEKQEKTADVNVEKLYAKIGQLEMGNDFFYKIYQLCELAAFYTFAIIFVFF